MLLLTVVAVLATSLMVTMPVGADATTSHAPRHMPRLVGLTRAQVYAVMKSDQLYFRTRGPGSANGTWRAVAAQSPAPGTLVAWHAEATLTTTMVVPHGPRRVPRLIGLSRSRTFAVMKRAGLYFSTRGPGSTNGTWVVVLHQSPAPGTRVRWHAQVALTVSTHRPKPVVKPRPIRATPTTVRRPTTTVRHETTTTTTTTTTVPVSTTTYPGETTTSTSSTTTTSVPVTTTTAHRTTTTIKKKAVRYRIGIATWYSYFPGRCATSYLPMGTRITVRNLATGRAIRCVVTDRENARGNRVVDLSETQFAQLQPLWRGVVRVKVSW